MSASGQKYLENYATPMGTVPISVIYGFEYPCEEISRKAITRRRRNPPTPGGDERPLPLPRKTKGCLSDLKQYRRARLVSGRQASLSRLPRRCSLVRVCPGPPARSVHKCQNMAEVRSWYWSSRSVHCNLPFRRRGVHIALLVVFSSIIQLHDALFNRMDSLNLS